MNNKKPFNVHLFMLGIYLLIVLLIGVCSCNPVKQVLKDKDKILQVWERGALDGLCANDTIIQSESDTTVLFDTLYQLEMMRDTLWTNNVQTITVEKTKIVTKTVHIKDTVKSVVVDRSQAEILKRDLAVRESKIGDLQIANKELKKGRNGWRFKFWGLLAVIIVYILRKPVWAAAKKLISPLG